MHWKGDAQDKAPIIKVTQVDKSIDDNSTFIELPDMQCQRIQGENIKGYENIHGWRNPSFEAEGCPLCQHSCPLKLIRKSIRGRQGFKSEAYITREKRGHFKQTFTTQ